MRHNKHLAVRLYLGLTTHAHTVTKIKMQIRQPSAERGLWWLKKASKHADSMLAVLVSGLNLTKGQKYLLFSCCVGWPQQNKRREFPLLQDAGGLPGEAFENLGQDDLTDTQITQRHSVLHISSLPQWQQELSMRGIRAPRTSWNGTNI